MTVPDKVAELTRTREPFVQATVVRAQKPTSAHAGDTALVRSDGSIDGFVGGTCAEASVREYGLMTLSTNQPLLLRIVPGDVRPQSREEGRSPWPTRACRGSGGDLPRAPRAGSASAGGR
ncbi:XdhC family protein [Blastococcus brunescens]|uniref:XdhC family protein n=1 Tax=Blastococcus brunescens TaxID=1564165 RepID=A0ABZ1AW56_9ACTN|nr:XdhC family protein [Blastococcus sp. BMG 8361]WRL62372.1 XdhC family protein [Blastococcus sp. BMG 8361]